MYITGPAALNKNLDEMLSDFKFLNVKKLISPDWSFHSDKKMLTNFINETSGKNIEHILFHAFPKVVKKFVREFPLEIQKKLLVISKEETIL